MSYNNTVVRVLNNNALTVDGYYVPFKQQEFTLCNSMLAVAGTNGPQGGDSGHGCRTYIRIMDLDGTDIRIRKLKNNRYNLGDGGVEIVLGGDCELLMMIDMFRYIADTLEKQSNLESRNGRTVSPKAVFAFEGEGDPD